jgi:hypothetical protein
MRIHEDEWRGCAVCNKTGDENNSTSMDPRDPVSVAVAYTLALIIGRP